MGWKSKSHGTGNAGDTITSGLEGAWTSTPTQWSNGYFDNLFGYDWDLEKSPAGAWQWVPTDPDAADIVPDAHDPDTYHPPMMFTTDLALRMDPIYGPISKRFHENPEEFRLAFAKAWYKLTHRDMGPWSRCLGPEVPEPQIWQDPVPPVDHPLIDDADAAALKQTILQSGLESSDLIRTAWASAATFRGSDNRGGVNGARIRLAPQKDWAVNRNSGVADVVAKLETIQGDFNAKQSDGRRVSLADLIVLAGNAAIEQAAREGGVEVTVPFAPGRTDATAEMTDVEGMAVLEPTADGFRNYVDTRHTQPAEALLVDRAQLLTLTAPEMTVLVGGMRVLNGNHDGSDLGVLTDQPGVLSNDFFVNLLDMDVTWKPSGDDNQVFEGVDRESGDLKWRGTRVDLIFGSNSQLRALAEVYAQDDARERFVHDFVAAWTRVMNLDRFDLDASPTR